MGEGEHIEGTAWSHATAQVDRGGALAAIWVQGRPAGKEGKGRQGRTSTAHGALRPGQGEQPVIRSLRSWRRAGRAGKASQKKQGWKEGHAGRERETAGRASDPCSRSKGLEAVVCCAEFGVLTHGNGSRGPRAKGQVEGPQGQ